MSQVLFFFFPLKIFVKLKYACILISLSAYYSVYMGRRALNIYIYIKNVHIM